MKKLLIMSLAILTAVPLWADMVYDPATGTIYSTPQSPDINQADYVLLLRFCIDIEGDMRSQNNGNYPSEEDILNKLSIFLKKAGTPTALRLLSDLKKNKIFYPDGSVLRHIWY